MWLFKSKKAELTDDELLMQFKSTKDLQYLEDLFNRYIHLVYGTCLRYLKVREKSQDAVIDIFEKVAAKLKEHDVTQFKAWLYALTRNHCLMLIRKESKAVEQPMDLFSQNLHNNIMDFQLDYHPYDIDGIEEERKQQLKECLEKLKVLQKECLNLFFFQEMCYKEISSHLKITLEKVKSNLQNGKRNLRYCMEKQHERG